MKIGSPLHAPAPLAEDKPATQVPRGTPSALEAGRSVSDAVSLSSTASRISTLQAGGADDFDEAKVTAIRDAIREGRFQVDASKIADRLIAEAAALVGPRSH